jgi:hypothetical protein
VARQARAEASRARSPRRVRRAGRGHHWWSPGLVLVISIHVGLLDLESDFRRGLLSVCYFAYKAQNTWLRKV